MYYSRHHIFILRTAAIIIGLFPSGSEKPSLFTPFLNNSKLLPTESNVIKLVQIILIVPITTELVQLNAILNDKKFFSQSHAKAPWCERKEHLALSTSKPCKTKCHKFVSDDLWSLSAHWLRFEGVGCTLSVWYPACKAQWYFSFPTIKILTLLILFSSFHQDSGGAAP